MEEAKEEPHYKWEEGRRDITKGESLHNVIRREKCTGDIKLALLCALQFHNRTTILHKAITQTVLLLTLFKFTTESALATLTLRVTCLQQFWQFIVDNEKIQWGSVHTVAALGFGL